MPAFATLLLLAASASAGAIEVDSSVYHAFSLKPSAVLRGALTTILDDDAMHQSATAHSDTPLAATAQAMYTTDHTINSTKSTTAFSASAMIQIMQQRYPKANQDAIAAFMKGCAADKDTLVLQEIAAASGFYTYSSALIPCMEKSTTLMSPWTVWFADWSASTSFSGVLDSTFMRTCDSASCTAPLPSPASMDLETAADALVYLTAETTARGLGAAITAEGRLGDWASAISNFAKSVKTITDALQSIASAFGSHTTNKIIAYKSCLGFSSFAQNTTVRRFGLVCAFHLHYIFPGEHHPSPARL